MSGQDLRALADKVDCVMGSDNRLDVQVEVALFAPTELYASIRANNAGTKVIGTSPEGHDATFWAWDWTTEPNRASTAVALRARAQQEPSA